MPGIPEGATHAFTKQHQTTGLQASYEGPFVIAERLSRSTVKLEVGIFKDGRKRYEIRHANDLKFAHPSSLAAPIQRPKLGRPPSSPEPHPDTSGPPDLQTSTEEDARILTDATNRFPDPPYSPPTTQSKQAVTGQRHATTSSYNHETSIQKRSERASASDRPVRSTRNPSPQYVDAVEVCWSTKRPWSATQADIAALNDSIRRRTTGH